MDMEFTLETILPATPQVVYDTWLDSDGHTAMTGADADITADEGDPFNAWDGYIWGKNLQLIPYSFIKQSWRTDDFEEDQEYSTVEITLTPHEEGTLLKLHHYELTERDHTYLKGWEEYYFIPMKAYFQ